MTTSVSLDQKWQAITEQGFSGLIQNTSSRDISISIGEPKSEKGHLLPSKEFMRFEPMSKSIYAKATSSFGEVAITSDDLG